MPKGPRGEKRPADVIGAAVMVAKIATGEIREELGPPKSVAAVERGKRGGAKGGISRAKRLSVTERKGIAIKAAQARWKKTREKA